MNVDSDASSSRRSAIASNGTGERGRGSRNRLRIRSGVSSGPGRRCSHPVETSTASSTARRAAFSHVSGSQSKSTAGRSGRITLSTTAPPSVDPGHDGTRSIRAATGTRSGCSIDDRLAGSERKQNVALRKLRMLDAATRLGDLRVPPGNRLERLRGDRSGQHSTRINDQWRICFRWDSGDAYDVEIVDYH